MKIILNKEIAKEMPNSQALGGLNEAYGQFINIAKTSTDGRDFVNKAREIKNVPPSVADKFSNTYGKGNVSMVTAGQRFVDRFKK